MAEIVSTVLSFSYLAGRMTDNRCFLNPIRAAGLDLIRHINKHKLAVEFLTKSKRES